MPIDDPRLVAMTKQINVPRQIVAGLLCLGLASIAAARPAPVSRPGGGAHAGPATIEQFRPHDVVLHASTAGNPHEVALTGELRGPNGTVLRIPGFYDGDDRWVIRFSAPIPGAWTLKTTSNLAALSGHERPFEASPAPASRFPGVLQVDPESKRHFRFADGSRFFPMGYEADWLWGADMTDPERKVMHRLIEQMDANGFNYVLVNVYAHDTKWAPGKSCEWDFGPPALYVFGGTNETPDHSRLNPAFFQAYDRMMWALWERGIAAHIMIKVYNKLVNWPEPGSREEMRFFQYVVARYQAFPNVVWDFSKESKYEKNDVLQRNVLAFIRAEDAYDHLVTLHDDESFLWNPALAPAVDFQTIQIHDHYSAMTRFALNTHPGPLLNSEFGYEFGVEPLPTHRHPNQVTWQVLLDRAYVVTLGGSFPVYYYNNTAWDVVKPDPEPPGMRRWRLLKEIVTAVPYWRMRPSDELAAGAVCLAWPGNVYVFYTSSAEFQADLRDAPPGANGTWINTWSGERAPAGSLEPGVRWWRKPATFGEAPAVLLVEAGTPSN